MLKVAAFVCVCAAAWCSSALTAAAGGRPDSGNFLDDKQWLTTISQYDKEVGQWNKFRDVQTPCHCHKNFSGCVLAQKLQTRTSEYKAYFSQRKEFLPI